MAQSGRTREPRLNGILLIPPVLTILGAMVLALLVIVGTYYLLVDRIGVDEEPLTQAQILTAAFATATAAGAVTALVVGIRKQALSEQAARQELTSAFTERFRQAASQIGGQSPAERIAGVYAMAALADDYPGRAQLCADVLCGYMRLPWDPERDSLADSSIDTTLAFTGGKTVTHHETQETRPLDQQVRQTIVTVIRDHTKPTILNWWSQRLRTLLLRDPLKLDGLWSHLNYDFTGARLHNVSFVGARFMGRRTSFAGTTFTGEFTHFAETIFAGGHTNFMEATFASQSINFDEAEFGGGSTDFKRATFGGMHTSFNEATFSGESIDFGGARFTSGDTDFIGATFAGKDIHFGEVTFAGYDTYFNGANFSGKYIYFGGATFSAQHVNFNGSSFSGEYIYFGGSTFTGDRVTFNTATFAGHTDLTSTFDGVAVTFDEIAIQDRATIAGPRDCQLLSTASVTADGRPFHGWPPPDRVVRPEPETPP